MLIGLLLVNFREATAQLPNFNFEHISTKEGLPSNNVWCTAKDKQGFLWIGTSRGAYRFDGYRYDTADSLKRGYCSGISVDSKGTIYISLDTQGLCVVDPKTLLVKTVLKNNYTDAEASNDLHEQVYVDSKDQAWLCDYTAIKRYDPSTGKLHQYAMASKEVHQYASFLEDANHNLWIISEIGFYQYDRKQDKIICLYGEEAVTKENRIKIGFSHAFEDHTGAIWLCAFDKGLVCFKPTDQSFVLHKKGLENQTIICGIESHDENGKRVLFVGTTNGVIVLYPDTGQSYRLTEFYNKGIHIKRIMDDKENGVLWFSTLDGLYKYRYRNPGIRTVNLPANVVTLPVGINSIIQYSADTYFLGLSHTGVLRWKSSTNQFNLLRYPVSTATHRLRLMGGQLYAFTSQGIFRNDLTHNQFEPLRQLTKAFTTTEFTDGLLDRKDRLWIANVTEGIKVLNPQTGQPYTLWNKETGAKLFRNNSVKVMQEGADGKVWIATCSKGLFFFDEATASFVDVERMSINKGQALGGLCINDLRLSDDKSILIASWGGVNKIAPSGKLVTTFDFHHPSVNDTYCSNICEDQSGNLWFSTNEGVHIANPKKNIVNRLTTIEGLYNNSPSGFLYNQQKELILGYTNALNILDINHLNINKIPPQVAVSSVAVQGRRLEQDISNGITIEPDENAVTLHFSTLNFEPISRNVYRYQLAGFDDKWIDLGSQNTVSFANLAPKTYTLNVLAGNSFGLWSKKPMVVKLTIKPRFHETWLFKGLVTLLTGFVVFGVIRWRVSTHNERNRLDLQIAELRLKALQSQMNPHFLFNSLNSIQNYLLNNRGVEGAKYLSKFSKLVRRIMENSNHPYLRFEQIIETLKMYVEIESFRFNHEFRYEFDIDEDDVLLSAQLPPMLLQPYVENAIWHGLMPKDGEKKLKISARAQNDHIICIIEDNGVGRTLTPRREGHISRGQEMTKGIFESLRYKSSKARLEIIDLFDNQNHPVGTRVELLLPIEKV
ncbi:histidine kinase [Spirosoma daeguense]